MHEVLLQSGATMQGYVINDFESVEMLHLEENKFTLKTLPSPSIKEIKELRPLTVKEQKLLKDFMSYTNELNNIKNQIEHLESCSKEIRDKRNNELSLLLKEAIIYKENESRNLTMKDMDEFLTETGYKNVFQLQRFGKLVLGENEEFLYLNEENKAIPFFFKQRNEVVTSLNEENLNVLQTLACQNIKQQSENEQTSFEKTNEKKQKERDKGSINIDDIKDQLSEKGFQSLKKLQNRNFLTIHNDGTLDFGHYASIPLFKDLLNDPKWLVDMLNQTNPFQSHTQLIPFPINGLIEDIVRQFNTFNKNE